MRSMLAATVCLLGALMVSAQEPEDISVRCETYHPAVACPKEGKEDWFKMTGGSCVKAFFGQPFLNFTEAEDACVGFGGHLVSIHSNEQLDDVVCTMYRLTPFRPPYWIGLYLDFEVEDYLIFDWTDDTGLDFMAWSYGQPNVYNGNEKCVEINLYDWGLWNDMNCSFRRGHVCAVKI